MAPIFFLLAVFVLYSSQIQGSSAVTPVFVKRGDDVLLEVMDNAPKEFLFLIWKFNTSNVLVAYSPGGKPTVSKGYTGRVEFSVRNYSVKLKNLQDTDSGVYTARVTGAKDQTIAEYMVTVQDSETNHHHIIAIVCTAIAVVVFIILAACYYRRKRGKNERNNIENAENTVYAVPEVALNQRSADDDSGLSPNSTYSLVGPHPGPKGSTKTKEKNLPESLYATVEKPVRS